MPASRVTRRHYENLSANWITKILALIAGILSWIGKPFYVFLTFVFILLFALIEKIGKETLCLAYKIISLSKITVISLTRLSLPKFHLTHYKKKNTFLPFKKTRFKVSRISFAFLPKLRFNLKKKRYKIITLASIALLAFTTFWVMLLKDLPKPGELKTRDQIVSTKIYDRNGNLLFKIVGSRIFFRQGPESRSDFQH